MWLAMPVVRRGVATTFRWGGRGGFRLEWTDSGESKLSTPKFGFLFEFRPLYFVNIGRSKKIANVKNFFL